MTKETIITLIELVNQSYALNRC